jgi:hypothetical protein
MNVGSATQLRLVSRTKTLLLVYDNETQLRIAHILCHDCAGSDDDVDRSVRQTRFDVLLLCRARKAGETSDGNTQTCEATLECLEMLAHKHGSRRCDHDLMPGKSSQRRSPERNFSLAIANIANDEPVHRAPTREIIAHGGDRPCLISRLIERESCDEALIGSRVWLQ